MKRKIQNVCSTEMDNLTEEFLRLTIYTTTTSIVTIQRWFRGSICRLKRLPLVMYMAQKCLKDTTIEFSQENDDGRINSSIDEDKIVRILSDKFVERLKKPKIRMWYDILLFDNFYGWIPINIKTTTTITCDNTGNLAMCVYAYTDEILDFNKSYHNGKMSNILFNKLKNNKLNKNAKKDYYFLVMNKNEQNDVIINSIKGLTILCSNINNLPFQINWNKNRQFVYSNVRDKIKTFIRCLQKPNPSWKETFMINIRTLES